jgi:hypothetical protein
MSTNYYYVPKPRNEKRLPHSLDMFFRHSGTFPLEDSLLCRTCLNIFHYLASDEEKKEFVELIETIQSTEVEVVRK